MWEEVAEVFLGNRRKFWKKVTGKEGVHKIGLGIESEDGVLLTEQEEIRKDRRTTSEDCWRVK